MYFAVNTNTDSIESYITFLQEIIKNDNQHYKSILSPIIKEAKKLLVSHDYYSIPSDRFFLITLLAKNNFLINSIDPDNLTAQNCKNIIDYLNEQSVLA
ncbi:MAG: hypothetical protein PHP52_12930 [Bacteroidales bacterium]|nr:hypothetical protein [Bacteroidales bacterium]